MGKFQLQLETTPEQRKLVEEAVKAVQERKERLSKMTYEERKEYYKKWADQIGKDLAAFLD